VTDTLSGNIGLRYVKTDTISSAYQPTGPAVFPIPASWWKTTKSSYHFLLPSFNIAYTPTDTVTLRAAAAKVIARQTISNEIPSLSLNAANVPPVGSGGNPELLPYKATNYSVAAEWNFKPQAAVGFEAFLIRINNYILRAPSLETHFTDEAQTAPQHFQQLERSVEMLVETPIRIGKIDHSTIARIATTLAIRQPIDVIPSTSEAPARTARRTTSCAACVRVCGLIVTSFRLAKDPTRPRSRSVHRLASDARPPANPTTSAGPRV